MHPQYVLAAPGGLRETGQVTSAAPATATEAVHAGPAPPLRGLIASYHGYRQEGLPPARHRGLPSPYLTLIITLDDPLTVAAHPDPRASAGRYLTLAGGLHTVPALITHEGRQSGVQIAMSPLGARALFGLPAGELAGIDVEATEVLGRTAAQLHERMRAAPDWPARFAVLDRLRCARADLDQVVHPDVAQAWRLILRSGGSVPVSQVAESVGWSARRLQDRLRAETGLAPKAAARVARFDRARRRLQRRVSAGEPPQLAQLAADVGYFDQAHLAREFRDLAGCAPSAWLAEEVPIRPSHEADPARQSGA
jgi:AraC-like DNA-binding protein